MPTLPVAATPESATVLLVVAVPTAPDATTPVSPTVMSGDAAPGREANGVCAKLEAPNMV